ncbi:atrial natriuretic peptide receptor 1-like [Biomphalaria glabrata]|uniref:Guanylate cyclase n=1 Tax=Biomphalaria glabrata TaxID=6526 RepID=A0A9W3BKM3_BIOGL|nr:atrial natriuretic peptide receptor 1-like [Biomphalaria glabrata]
MAPDAVATETTKLITVTLILTWHSVFSVKNVTGIKIGVLLISDINVPYSIQRTGPAIHIAVEKVNQNLMEGYRLVTVIRVYDNLCDARYASGAAAELHFIDQVQAIVGPGCSNALDHVARLAAYWNIPIVTGLGENGIFNNKTTYPTLTRFAYCQCRIRSVFANTFTLFKWTNIALIYDHSDGPSDILGTTLKDGLPTSKYYPEVIGFYSEDKSYDAGKLLQEAAKNSRIIIFALHGNLLREFMLKAYDLGYAQSGDFVFMNVELFPFPSGYWGNNHWARNDSLDPIAKKAYESLLRVSLYFPIIPEWWNFTQRCKEMSQRDWNFTYGTEEVNYFVGAFHDAVIRLGSAINATLANGSDLSDGRAVTRRMWNYISHDITGDVIIDYKGDRNSSFALKDLNPVTGEFEIVAYFLGDRPNGLTLVPNKSIHWPGGRTSPPPNVPFCGYQNENPKCQPPEHLPTYMVVIIAAFAVIVLSLIVGFLVYRRIEAERELNSTAWRVNYCDIKFRQAITQSAKFSLYSLATKESDAHSQDATNQTFTLVGVYNGDMVAVKKLKIGKIDVTRQVLLELKTIRSMHHENLASFLGACVDPGHLCLLYEYCKKGSLQDVLLNDSIKLDWTFKVSLLKDVAKGMTYIHHSELGCHGRLTSSNCVVDGKFNVKITDYGLPSFRAMDNNFADKEDGAHSELQKLMWVAPENIRQLKCMGGSKKGDVYSFGIIMDEVMTRSVPYDSHRAFLEVNEIIQKVCSNMTPPFRPELLDFDASEDYISLMEKCWAQDPEVRPTFENIVKIINTFSGGKDVALVDRLLTRLEEYTSNLEDLVQERTQQLAQEKKKSELLLDEILPREVSEKLKQGLPVDPETYDMVTIYFSDIVGFTSLSAASSPLEVVALLNSLYSNFDSTIENFDVYKVETIGDAYMVVSGLPIRNGDNHVLNIARLALALLDVVARFIVPHKPAHKLQLRIGLHSGPVVAGVVGLKMPRYCLFGDTVNTASRMESNGAAQKIHISGDSKQLLDKLGQFQTELRGQVELKGKGSQVTYWLLREIDSVKFPNDGDSLKTANNKLNVSRESILKEKNQLTLDDSQSNKWTNEKANQNILTHSNDKYSSSIFTINVNTVSKTESPKENSLKSNLMKQSKIFPAK